jgi:DNA-binding protein HU-beta
MTKADLIDAVAKFAGLTKTDAGKAIDGVFTAISGALKKGDAVRIPDFGGFSVSTRAAREGRNPRTGEKLKIPASKAPKFTAGKALKEAVNK